MLAVRAMLVIAFYFLPTRVHDRYLFPVMALLVPFAVAPAGGLIAYIVMATGFAASLLFAPRHHGLTSSPWVRPRSSWRPPAYGP